jgi:hypothetical protein
MPLLGFQKQFVPKVLSGEKRHTIRKRRKHPIKIGDVLYLYFGLRTKHSQKLREEICTNVIPMTIRIDGVLVGDEWISAQKIDEFARSDGFEDGTAFFAFWRKEHGLSIDNPLDDFDLIQWEPTL